MTKRGQLRYEYFIETGIVWIDTNDNIEMDYLKWVENKALTIPDVVKSLPSIVEINFDGNLKCQIETTDKSLTVLKAVNGYGNSVDCNKNKTIVTEI
tara:strand:- start:20 stop:310 length:291 start_codon:yes stop_codon:yes gene_type:complete